jgi:poly-gamma-glutamate capsule biosynthesis protein CapA/YwtB (metallophosphatase superfamily)
VDAGADVCLGHHPHVLQAVEWYRGKPIAYSMGNFIFKRGNPLTAYSGVFTFTIAPDGFVTANVIPVRSGFQATFAAGAAADTVRRRVRLVGPLPIILFATLP